MKKEFKDKLAEFRRFIRDNDIGSVFDKFADPNFDGNTISCDDETCIYHFEGCCMCDFWVELDERHQCKNYEKNE